MLPLRPRRPLLSSLALSGISLAGCGSNTEVAEHPRETATAAAAEAASTEPAPPVASVAPPPRRDPGIDLETEVTARSVSPGNGLAFKVLYSWTTDAQLAELVSGQPLLTRSVSKKNGMSMFDDLVAADQARNVPIAKLLWHEVFAKKRFAWPSPYSALRGGDTEGDYGKVLLRVELRPDAWIVDYDNGGVVYPVDGTPARGVEDAIAHPERIAAVYHQGPGFREFVIVNDAMVARVDGGGTKATRAALAADIELLQALAAHLEDEPGDVAVAQRFPQTSIFSEPFTPSELRKRAKSLDAIRGLQQPSFEKEIDATPPLDKVAKGFSLGPPRAPIAPYCKVVRRDAVTSRRFRGSFTLPGTVTTYHPVCEDPSGTQSEKTCAAIAGETPSAAVCLPIPAFAE